MLAIVINAGSSSIRLAAFRRGSHGPERLAEQTTPRQVSQKESFIRRFLEDNGIAQVHVVAHRVVHGGDTFSSSAVFDDQAEKHVRDLCDLAPLHNPVALEWLQRAQNVFGHGVPQVAVFDTTYFNDLPAEAQHYAIPRNLAAPFTLRRYGFHGIAHKSMWRRWALSRKDLKSGGRLISLQLGSGCSITATLEGAPKDTSMGFTPLEGLVMATRSGDVDPGLLLYLQEKTKLSLTDCADMLNRKSGLLGISGLSGDMSELLASDSDDARLAVSLYCYRIRKYIGAYMAVLGGADGIVFSGGVGENGPMIRQAVLSQMEWCGVSLDPVTNQDTVGKSCAIHSPLSSSEVWVYVNDEASEIAKEAFALVGKGDTERLG